MKITIGGLAGSGTSTVAKILSRKLKIKHIDAGNIWDEVASEKKTDVSGLSKIAELDDSIDKELDKRMVNYAKNRENMILEGRLIGALCYKENIDAFKIWLDASFKTRIERVNRREKKDINKVQNETKRRDQSDIERYSKYYHIDILDKSFYDLVISSEKLSPEEISELILNKINSKH